MKHILQAVDEQLALRGAALGHRDLIGVTDAGALRHGSGAGEPDAGGLVTCHVTDDPERVLDAVKNKRRLQAAYGSAGKFSELGAGLYASGAPQMWAGRATQKWSFLSRLDEAQRQRLADQLREILEDQRQRGYITEWEFERGVRDVTRGESSGTSSGTAFYWLTVADQPYNIAFWRASFLRPLGIEPDPEPSVVELRVEGPVAELTRSHPDPRLLRDLRRSGVVGAFTPAGWSTNPELVVWDVHAIKSARVNPRCPG